uniref:Uncharacterized protein n=1 Tax=Cyclopterus lumpus TaxID=8103 RepID=A0A8C2WL44_CYCLU
MCSTFLKGHRNTTGRIYLKLAGQARTHSICLTTGQTDALKTAPHTHRLETKPPRMSSAPLQVTKVGKRRRWEGKV